MSWKRISSIGQFEIRTRNKSCPGYANYYHSKYKFWISSKKDELYLCKDLKLYTNTFGNTLNNVACGWYTSLEEAKETIKKFYEADSVFILGGAL